MIDYSLLNRITPFEGDTWQFQDSIIVDEELSRIDAEMASVQMEIDAIPTDSIPFDNYDVITVFATATIEVLMDFLLSDPANKNSFASKCNSNDNPIGKWCNSIHEKLDHSGNPLDFQGRFDQFGNPIGYGIKHKGPNISYGGGNHRGLTNGHDLLRFFDAIRQYHDGVFRDAGFIDGVKIAVESSINQYGNPYVKLTWLQSIWNYVVHMFADFFSNKDDTPKNRNPLKIFLPIVVVVAVIALVVSLVAFKNDAYTSMTNAYIAFLLCAPMSAFISFAYPAYLGSLRSYSHGAAILSEATPEKYEKTSVVTFSDEDAFPADKIRMKSVKVLDNNSIEKVIYYAASVFSKIGGPLATVFGAAAFEKATSDSVEIKELSDLGIDAIVDGKHVVVGQPEYMENQCFETVKEDVDDEYGGKTNKRILYLACDEVIIAKFYIQYNTSPDFIYIVKHLHEDGICVAISTIDPCIDSDLLYKNRLDPDQYAIKVIKGSAPDGDEDVVSARDGGIASTGTLKGMIKTLLLCDKLVSISRTNFAMKLVASVIGAVVAGLLIATGNAIGWLTIYPALYQLFWLIPTFIVSKVYVK